MDDVITEFKVIETEDGFRIEIKGDKEKIKEFMSGFGGHRGWKRGRKKGFFWGPFGPAFHPAAWMNMASWWGPWDFEEDEEDT